MSRGRRYDEEPKLNIKKVIAVIVAIIVIIMSIFIIKDILTKDNKQTKITSKDYMAVFKDNKWGVIDSEGNEVIAPSYEEMVTIPNSKNDVFLCVYDVDYNTGEYKTKALNGNNEEILTQYEKIEAISNQDENNNIWYESNMLKAKKDGKYGLVDLNGKELTNFEYEEITIIPGLKETVKVKKDGKYGILDNQGKEILPVQYTDITNLGNDNKDGYIITGEDGKKGIVNYSNNIVLEAKYDEITKIYGNDMYVIKQGGKQILVNKDGEEKLSTGFDEIKQILKNTENGIIFTQNNKYGVMGLAGDIKIEPEYDYLKETKTGIFIANKGGKFGVIDIQNAIKLELNYISMTYNEKADIYIAEKEGYVNDIIDNQFSIRQSGILLEMNNEKEYIKLRQGEEDKYYNFKFEEKNVTDIQKNNTLFKSKKDGKYGFVDKEGKVIVEYNYDDVTEQNIFRICRYKKRWKMGSN